MVRSAMMLIVLAATATLLTQPGPSFDCRRATTGAEHAICADPILSALDRDMADSYAAARSRLGPRARVALRSDQQAFLRLRELIHDRRDDPVMADYGGIGDQMAGRTSFLDSVEAPHGPGLVGIWGNLYGSVEVRDAGEGRLIAEIATVNPEAARWICEVEIRAVPRRGRLTGRPDGEGSVTVSLERGDGFLRVTETWPDGERGQPDYCGNNGFVAGDYLPVRAP